MLVLSQFKPNWTAIGVIVVVVINITGWFVHHYLTMRRERQRDQRAAEIAKAESISADKKRRDAETAVWRNGLREVVVPLRTEMVRAQTPSDWFQTFDVSIPILSRITATIPTGIDSQRRDEISSIVRQLCSMSAGGGSQAVYGAPKVVELLQRLEELTNDT
jgi:hypothetical protein